MDGIIAAFTREAPVWASAITSALASRNGPAIAAAAHAFKSAAGTIGARTLASMLESMEGAAKAGRTPDAVKLAGSLDREIKAVLAQVSETVAVSVSGD